MELFNQPVDFVEAIRALVQKKLLPTSLTSAELKQLGAAQLRQSMTSAQTLNADLLQQYKNVVESILSPKQVLRPGETQTVTEGMNPAKAHESILTFLKGQGYAPEPGTEGTIQDLSSLKRIKLVVQTNSQTSWGAGVFVQQNADPDVVDLYPALELYRLEDRKDPRDWPHRWLIAAQVAGDPSAAAALNAGRMVALKSSGIWQALGDGAGGYDDTLGNPYPPFAFQSGMWTQDVRRADAEALGLLDAGEDAKPAAFDLAELFSAKEAA